MDTNNIRGEFTITCTNTDTGETRTIKNHNAIVDLARSYIPASTTACGLSGSYCHISDKKYTPNNNRLHSMYMQNRESTRLGLVLADPFEADTTDYYFERTYRFDSTGTANTINTICISYTSTINTYIYAHAYTVLSNPFIQGTNEVMDITYRISFNTTALSSVQAIKWANSIHAAHSQTASTSSIQTKVIDTYIPQSIIDSFGSFGISPDIVLDNSLETSEYSSLSKLNVDPLLKTDVVGSCLKSITQVILNGSTTNGDNNYTKMATHLPVLKDNSVMPSYPLSPLFNHSYNANSIFEDVSNLATGLGYPIVSTSSPTWIDDHNQEQYIFRITKSGNTGVSRYEIIFKSTAGSVDHTNNNTHPNTCLESFITSCNTNYKGLFHTSLTDKNLQYLTYPTLYPHDYDTTYDYNADWSVYLGTHADSQEIGLLFLNHSNPNLTFGLDTGTTPALGVGLKRTYTSYLTSGWAVRNDAGTLYICVKTGLMVITDPLGTPVITYISLIDLGFTTEPLNIAISNNNAIYCRSADKIAISTNGGTSFTTSTITAPSTTQGIIAFNDTNYVGLTSYSNSVAHIWNISTDSSVYYKANSGHQIFMPLANSNWLFMSGVNQNGLSSPASYFMRADGSSIFGLPTTFAYYSNRNARYFIKDGLDNTLIASNGISSAYNNRILVNMDMIVIANDRNNISNLGEDYSLFGTNNSKLEVHSELDGIPFTKASMNLRNKYFTNDCNVTKTNLIKFPRNTNNIFLTPEFETSMFNHVKVVRDTIHRWNGSSWVTGWNKPTDATADGSYTLTAIRRNFDTDSNRFNSGCSLDISAAVNSTTYVTNGFMILVTATPETKNTGTFNGTDWRTSNIGLDTENPITCLFEFTENSTKRSVALLTVGYNNKTVVVDSTDPANPTYTDLENQPINGQYRYAMSISSDGTTVKFYRDATQIGNDITLMNSINMASNYEVTVGSRNRSPMDGIHNLGANYKGKIENIQVFNTILTAGELSNDAGTPLGLTTPTTNLVVRYLMTMDYNEGKPTHSTDESTIGGVNIRFPDGDLSNDSYVKNDNYLCYKIKDGLMKDNTSSFDLTISSSNLGKVISTVTSPIDGTSVIPSTSATVTEFANFNTFQVGNDNSRLYGYNRDVVLRALTTTIFMTQSSLDDLVFEFTVGHMTSSSLRIKIGNPTTLGAATYATTLNMATLEILDTNTDIVLYDETGASQTLAGLGNHNTRLKFEWIKASDIVKLSKWDGSNWVQQGVDAPLSAANVGSKSTVSLLCSSSAYCNIADIKITYNPDPYIMRIGDKTTSTGAYNDGFLYGTIFSEIANTLTVALDGVNIPISYIATNVTSYVADNIPSLKTPPTAGSCNYFPTAGLLQFNSADAGKTVTINGAYMEIL